MKIRKGKRIVKELKEWSICLLMPIMISIFINSEVFALTEVNGISMENTLTEGEKLCIDKVSYKFSEPKSGDAIVFLQGEINKSFEDRITNVFEDLQMKIKKEPRRNRFIKRVIGIPGDVIDIQDSEVYVNNQLLKEAYIKGNTIKKDVDYPITIPEGKLFVMGDNRENSYDSRAFGLVDYRSIEGKAVYRILPINSLGQIE